MRRAALNAATVLSLLCALVTLAATQTPQLCANPTTTSTGTENYARMCGVNASAACGATVNNDEGKTWHGPPGVAVDGVLSSAGTGFRLGFFTKGVAGSRHWWRVDFGTQRHVRRVYVRRVWDNTYAIGMNNAQIIVGDTDDVLANPVCGSWGTFALDNVVTLNCVGRFLFVRQLNPNNQILSFSELQAFGPCTCPAGSNNPSAGSGPCVACPVKTYKSLTDTGCQPCPLISTSLQGSTSIASCTCPADLVNVPVGGCTSYELRTVASSPTGVAGTRIQRCPPGQVSPADSTSLADCACAPGFSPAGWTETTQDFVCNSAWMYATENYQLTCMHENGTVLPFVYYTEPFPCVQVTRAECQTAALTNAFHFSVHIQYDGGKICFGVLENETKQALMNEPDCNQIYGTGSQSFLVTLRHPLGACEPCAADSYKAAAGDAACAPCGAGKRSLPGAETQDECLCDAGFTGAQCEACAHNTYKTHVGSAPCRACPGNTSQTLGSSGATALASCQCSAGHRGPDGGPCLACGANTFKPAAGAHACTGCHSNSVSLPASTASAQCVCDAGYTATNTSQCAACGAGTYKNATGNQACSACPANTVTVSPDVDPNDPAAPPAVARTDCICGPGFAGPPARCARPASSARASAAAAAPRCATTSTPCRPPAPRTTATAFASRATGRRPR